MAQPEVTKLSKPRTPWGDYVYRARGGVDAALCIAPQYPDHPDYVAGYDGMLQRLQQAAMKELYGPRASHQ